MALAELGARIAAVTRQLRTSETQRAQKQTALAALEARLGALNGGLGAVQPLTTARLIDTRGLGRPSVFEGGARYLG